MRAVAMHDEADGTCTWFSGTGRMFVYVFWVDIVLYLVRMARTAKLFLLSLDALALSCAHFAATGSET
jgi:hypothetical protein